MLGRCSMGFRSSVCLCWCSVFIGFVCVLKLFICSVSTAERVFKYLVCCLSEYTYGQPVSLFDKTQHVVTAFEIYNVVYSAREILMVSYKTSLRDFGMSPSYSYRSRHARTQIRYTVYDEVSSVVACYVSLTPGST